MATATATATIPMIQGVSFRPETDIKYSKAKVNSSGGKSVGVVNAHTGQTLFMGTPLLMTWGIQEFTDEKTKKVSYDMSLQFPSEEYQSADSKAFLQAMVAFEKKLKADALVNSKDWFANGKFGVTWRLVQGIVQPKLSMKGRCHLSLTPSETVKLQSEADKQQQQEQQQFCDDDDVPSAVPVTETVDSDDGESDEEEDGGFRARTPSIPVAAPPVQPQSVASAEAPKKKIIKKAV